MRSARVVPTTIGLGRRRHRRVPVGPTESSGQRHTVSGSAANLLTGAVRPPSRHRPNRLSGFSRSSDRRSLSCSSTESCTRVHPSWEAHRRLRLLRDGERLRDQGLDEGLLVLGILLRGWAFQIAYDQEIRRNVVEKAARVLGPTAAHFGPRDIQLLTGTGDPDVAQTSFFRQIRRVRVTLGIIALPFRQIDARRWCDRPDAEPASACAADISSSRPTKNTTFHSRPLAP
jgi:hypothetical protein